jgi:NAD(P)-dependent dehydrogenase (short-subunit alcohol dehydrogenase family)
MELDGQVAIVTGAAGGIGLSIATELGARGAAVTLVDKRSDELKRAANKLEGAGYEAVPLTVDVTSAEAVRQGAADVAAHWGRIDILVNNAGGALVPRRVLEDVTDEDWHFVLDLNLTSAFYWCRAVAEVMKVQKSGSIVNMSSQTARTGTHHLVPGYPAAKAGLLGLTRQLARELGPAGIRVNAVAPGLILSNAAVRAEWEALPPEARHAQLETIPLRRLGEPVDVAKVVVFLASADAAYITGQVIYVSGGQFFSG